MARLAREGRRRVSLSQSPLLLRRSSRLRDHTAANHQDCLKRRHLPSPSPSTLEEPVAQKKRRRGEPHEVEREHKRTRVTPDHHLQSHRKTSSRRQPRAQRHPSTPDDHTCGHRTRQRRIAEGPSALDTPASICEEEQDPIAYWAFHHQWPKGYIEKTNDMEDILARKRSLSSRSRKNSDAGSTTPSSSNQSNQQTREQKSAEYNKPQYETVLATKGIIMEASAGGVSRTSRSFYKELLEREQELPKDTMFEDGLFDTTCKTIRNRNETRVIRDIALLIVPSAEIFATRGATHLQCLIESVNDGWNNCIPITKTRPQPDFAVGFRREAFTQDQLDRMHPVVGDFNDQSYFMATCMAIAARAVVELFRAVKREKELHRAILAFSVSHDHRSVRVYGYYAEIWESGTKYYRHPTREFSFTELDGKEKWTAYRFTKNLYDYWMPMHSKRICSAIDQIPAGISFSESQSELHFTEQTGLSQDMSANCIAQSSTGSVSTHAEDITISKTSQDVTAPPGTSVDGGAVFKKPRKGKGR
ncbi:hypothetical protein LTR91_023650 [Friedmanniomyces endolithicus]|uniref:DUF7924 domain-containing protein n=1 Tax=Friedmanniomyces endolithicus TaxID=329885 RepID=A0AAN6H3P5_9PEZI|nr:hypothetical protein LTR57_023437 [Friedmanniomyces endolithicus]KAK0952603.1 hypothetical protein LTS01_024757 [Friedmanniomyces endolithicus]KAK0953806.1 hypothetical protein LTR91_023650 [Friedmanniomyces endolithicus]KAK1021839.1 hypothetical protein LTS16_026201 [Friedmanniomyces endolithicus]